ncbi:MAG: MATE family efflux transporter [Oscillospiraceae bacterium]|nr:MATE family efflux transporter [Oscillospiraceae bacterium]
MAAPSIEAQREARRRMMLEDPISRVIPIVAIPTVISMLIDSFYNLADTFFVSQLGTFATAAVGVNDSLMLLLRAVAMGFGTGAASYISRLLGAKRDDDASRVGVTALLTSMGAGVLMCIIGYLFMEPLVMLLGSTENSKAFTMDYARLILLAAPFTAGEVVLTQLLRSEGSTRFAMFGMVSGCVLNIGLDPLFINVLGWGVAGAARATAISKVVSFCVLLVPFLRKKTVLELRLKLFTPKWSIYKEIAKMGVPTFLRTGLMSVASIVTNSLAGGYSDAALAAISVGNKCMRFVGSLIIGFSQGFQPVAGYCWGAKKYRRVLGSFRFTVLMGVIISVVLGGLMALFARQLVGVFSSAKDPEVIRLGTLMIRSQCLMLIIHMLVLLAGGLFQALGRAVNATILNLSRQVIAFIPSIIVMNLLFGVNGLAVAQAVSDVVSGLIAAPLTIKLLREISRLAKAQEAQA